MKQSTELTLMKRGILFIHEEDKIHETPPDVAAALSIMLLLNIKPCTIQVMTIWSQQFNGVS